MAMPPLPPQPPRPPDNTPPPGGGGFGPLPEGFGPPPAGYGPPPGGNGPPWQGGGGGGWQPPPPPPSPPPGRPGGPGRRRRVLLLVLAVIVTLGAGSAVALVATSGDGSSDKKSPSESDSATGGLPTPSLSIPSELPSELPSLPTDVPSGLPSGVPTDLDSLLPSLAGDDVPYYMLQTGDCFNIDDTKPGQATKRSCRAAHDAEVVKVAELEGTYATDAALKKAASALCAKPWTRRRPSSPPAPCGAPWCSIPTPRGSSSASTRSLVAWPRTSVPESASSPNR